METTTDSFLLAIWSTPWIDRFKHTPPCWKFGLWYLLFLNSYLCTSTVCRKLFRSFRNVHIKSATSQMRWIIMDAARPARVKTLYYFLYNHKNVFVIDTWIEHGAWKTYYIDNSIELSFVLSFIISMLTIKNTNVFTPAILNRFTQLY